MAENAANALAAVAGLKSSGASSRPQRDRSGIFGMRESEREDVEEEVFSVVQGQEASSGHNIDMSHAVLLDREGDAFVLSRSKDLSHLHEDLRLIHDIFLLTLTAALGGAAASYTKAPTIIGYLVGGAVVGPGGLDGVQELVQVESVCDIGVCLLLFCLGLELSMEDLIANSRAAVAGLLSMALVCSIIVMFAVFCSETPAKEALCIGLFASLASTPVSLQAIQHSHHDEADDENSVAASGESNTLLGVLVAQDAALALFLAAMPAMLSSDQPGNQSKKSEKEVLLLSHGLKHGGLVGLTLASLPLGLLLLAWQRRHSFKESVVEVAQRGRIWLMCRDSESFTLSMLSYAFMLSHVSERLGLSMELGAFLGGLAIRANSEDLGHRTFKQLLGLKETFVALFFASIGLVVSPHFLFDNLGAMLSVVAFTFILKLVSGFVPLWLLAPQGSQSPALSAIRASWVLAHVSEFGFVLAAKGAAWGALSRHVYLLLVGANAVSLCLAPWQFWIRDFVFPPLIAVRRSQASQSRKSDVGDIELQRSCSSSAPEKCSLKSPPAAAPRRTHSPVPKPSKLGSTSD
eukprot:TRINITY_DN10560_c1_g1_i1.p1 TRINITY_DN10560_c1_g1~~TRINITY_DN10560_c1_g1_i1.p1  ORF type:complete len:676 (-),score=118.05 TRINITY_DN10560_c1_g1_i1:483-2210(-)